MSQLIFFVPEWVVSFTDEIFSLKFIEIND